LLLVQTPHALLLNNVESEGEQTSDHVLLRLLVLELSCNLPAVLDVLLVQFK